MPKFSCIDINRDVEGYQPWTCDESQGWFWNQDASYLPNPSNDVCCLVSELLLLVLNERVHTNIPSDRSRVCTGNGEPDNFVRYNMTYK
jgi:hypothetical protein